MKLGIMSGKLKGTGDKKESPTPPKQEVKKEVKLFNNKDRVEFLKRR